jgi:hypothetical protein
MKIKNTLVAIVLSSCYLHAFSVEVKKVHEKNNTLHIELSYNIPYKKKMIGMLDNDQESIARSLKDGASLQFFIPHPGIEYAQVDKEELIKQVDSFVENTAKYFKLHPEYKGMLVANFVIFPGYKNPFQTDLSQITNTDSQKEAIELNKQIKENSHCNKKQFCQLTGLMKVSFLNSKKAPPFNTIIFSRFLDKQQNKNIEVYTNNKRYLTPIPYYIYIGTNGYLISHEQMEKELIKIKKSLHME